MRRNNKQVTTYFILFSLLLIGVVYAILQANLQINGTAKIKANTWDIHFDNIQVNENSVPIGTEDSPATIDPNNNCKVDFEVTLGVPGDFYEFTIDVVNAGTIDGMIGELNKTLIVNNEPVDNPPDYLDYIVTYSDGIEIEENHNLEAGSTETYKVRLEFKTDIEELPSASTISTSLIPQYVQSDSNSIIRTSIFEVGTWEQIVDAYNSGAISSLQTAMEAGITREVELDMDFDGTPETTAHLRIANLSTPAECLIEDFSQTGCGFVLEFVEIISTHRMNYYDENVTGVNGINAKGGWEYSDMRAYLNSKKYREGETEEIDYTSSGIYNALPIELKNSIINTKTLSGHCYSDANNYITIDKLFLLDAKEVLGKNFTYLHHSAKGKERQLDYYEMFSENIEENEQKAVKKKLNGDKSAWWNRSAQSNTSLYFFSISSWGGWDDGLTYITRGVSPAFRIAE